jgi:hypothetical protein
MRVADALGTAATVLSLCTHTPTVTHAVEARQQPRIRSPCLTSVIHAYCVVVGHENRARVRLDSRAFMSCADVAVGPHPTTTSCSLPHKRDQRLSAHAHSLARCGVGQICTEKGPQP